MGLRLDCMGFLVQQKYNIIINLKKCFLSAVLKILVGTPPGKH